MIDWDDPDSWYCPVPELRAVPEIFETLGKKIYGAEWTGRERELCKPPVLPKPAEVYATVETPLYKTSVKLGRTSAIPPTAPGSPPLVEDQVADFVAYNRNAAYAAELVGAPDPRDVPVTFAQWCAAFDKAEHERLLWDQAARRRKIVFTFMHRRAAAGDLVFCAFHPDTGRRETLAADVWACQFDTVRARFLRGAFSFRYPTAVPPTDPDSLVLFNRSFDLKIYATNSCIAEILRRTTFEETSTSVQDVVGRTADALLQVANAATAPAATATVAAAAHDGPSIDASVQAPAKVVTTADIQRIVERCVADRLGVEPTRKAIREAFPLSRIPRTRVRALHAEKWTAVYGDAPTSGANSRAAI